MPLKTKVDVSDWKNEIKEELEETFQHLQNEVHTTIYHYTANPKDRPRNSYLNHDSFEVFQDTVLFISGQSIKYRIFKQKIKRDMESLRHYVNFRLENSLELIIAKTVQLANNIKISLSVEDFPSYALINSKERKTEPQEYIPLDHLNEIIGFDINLRDWENIDSSSKFEMKSQEMAQHFRAVMESKEMDQSKKKTKTILSLCKERHDFLCEIGEHLGLYRVQMDADYFSDDIQKHFIKKGLKEYETKKEAILKKIMKAKKCFKVDLEELKIEINCTMNALEMITNGTISREINEHNESILWHFTSRLLGASINHLATKRGGGFIKYLFYFITL